VIETPLWHPAEFVLHSRIARENALQECELRATFTAPSGRQRRVYGFWDGGDTWRVRFAPDEIGTWTGLTSCSDASDGGLHGQALELSVGEAQGETAFERHGPIRVASNGRHFEHLDGTPFFWLADTCWNGPLRSDDAEWQLYLDTRTRQSFTAVQWVATQFLAAVSGDRDGRVAFSGIERIVLDPAFFQRLDGKVEAMARAGLLGIPVLLWAAEWTDDPAVNATNPGYYLDEDQAILLARHMVARWDAYPEHSSHFRFPGCFRCHDGLHESADGDTVSAECTTCHVITAQGPSGDMRRSKKPEGLAFEHPPIKDLEDAWQDTPCTDCHAPE